MSLTVTSQPLSVVIPAYNEEATVAHVINTVLAVSIVGEVIVVDDCSSDKTSSIVQTISDSNEKVRLLRHEVN